MEQKDLQQIKAKGISEAQIEKQIKQFETGFPFLKLEAAAAIGKGIMAPNKQEAESYVKAWEEYKASGKKIVKFLVLLHVCSRISSNIWIMVKRQTSSRSSWQARTSLPLVHN